jgi:peptidoglycan/xylan/chitin deacetylase (PgdA/CDA1 family)
MVFATQIEERYEQMRHVARDLVYGRTVLPGSDIQEVALTFDDGPNDPYTLQLLELLALPGARDVLHGW